MGCDRRKKETREKKGCTVSTDTHTHNSPLGRDRTLAWSTSRSYTGRDPMSRMITSPGDSCHSGRDVVVSRRTSTSRVWEDNNQDRGSPPL